MTSNDGIADFKRLLRELRASVGEPGDGWFRRLPPSDRIARSTLWNLLNDSSKPRLVTVELFLSGCEAYARTEKGSWPGEALDRSEWLKRYRDLPVAPGPRRAGPADRKPAADRRQLGVVPRPAGSYQDRDLTAVLGAPGGMHVLTGLGGVGKTQIAARLARRLWTDGEIDDLIWVQAGSRDRVVGAYANALAKVAGLPAEGEDDEVETAGRLVTWLETTERRWLIVLDDVADPADLRGLWPPTGARGRTVVTTRRTDSSLSADGREIIRIATFTEVEALRYVHEKLSGRPGLAVGAERLVVALGGLPLALAQAIAYQLDTDLSCEAYLDRLDRRALRGLAPHTLPDDQAAPVAATWSLSIALADTLPPAGLATPVLRLAAVLDPDGIPEAVFVDPAVSRVLAAGRTVAHGGAALDPEDPRDALRCLRRLSLIDIDPDDDGWIRAHALVQRATREAVSDDELADLRQAAADALVAIWPTASRDRGAATRLYANASALLDAGDGALYDGEVHPLVIRAGESLAEYGALEAAADHFTSARLAAAARLAADHPGVLRLRHEEMYWLGRAGYDELAAELAGPLVADLERTLGRDDELTGRTRLFEARYLGVRNPAKAVARLTELLAELTGALGPEHDDTLTTRNDLAQYRGAAGDADGAAEDFRLLAADRQRILGPRHEHTLITRNNYGYWTGKAGRPEEAVEILTAVAADCRDALGPEHRYSLGARGNLILFRGRSRRDEMAALCAELVRHFGPRDPMTVKFEGILDNWRG